jgi:hypothetical protein
MRFCRFAVHLWKCDSAVSLCTFENAILLFRYALPKMQSCCFDYSIERLFFGQDSTQSPHLVHLSLFTSHFVEARSTVSASDGHFLTHIPQNTQVSLHFNPVSPAATFGSSGFSNVSAILMTSGVV